jgi:hypothetical protein
MTTTTRKFKPGDKIVRTGRPHGKLTPGEVYTVAENIPGHGGDWITLEGVFYHEGHFWEFLADEFSLVSVETKEELFTITQPWDLKPGDVVDTVPEPRSSAGVQVRRQVPVAPPAPLPPTAPGSFILVHGISEDNRHLPTTPLFLSPKGWLNRYATAPDLAGWNVAVIQQRGFTVVHDEGAKG